MVEGDGADGVEAPEIVFVGVVETVPGDYVEGGVGLLGGEEVSIEFGEEGVFSGCVFVETGDWGLEVARVGETVGADGTEFGELEVALVEFEDVAAYWALR